MVREYAAGDNDRSAEQNNEVLSPSWIPGQPGQSVCPGRGCWWEKVKGHVECKDKLGEKGKTAEQDKEGKSFKGGGEVRDNYVDKVINKPRVSPKDMSESVEQKENKELNKAKEILETKTN